MNNNTSYGLLDSGNGRKLEKFGAVTISRPCATAYWRPQCKSSAWTEADALFSREEGLQWEGRKKLPESWSIELSGLKMMLKATDFGHLGVFPEQESNWRWIRDTVAAAASKREVSILNLFAYSGGSSLAAAQGGASVCHLDASKGMVEWARNNAELNGLQDAPIRWIVDDAMKFLQREERRGRRYDGIILDPPSYGRGSRSEVFKIEDDILPLLAACKAVLSDDPLFILFSCHTPGFTPVVMQQLLQQAMGINNGTTVGYEMVLEGNGDTFSVPSGTCARWQRGGQ